jgi:HEAT repeat protein
MLLGSVAACLAASFAVILVRQALRGREPEFEGKPLTHWLQLYRGHEANPGLAEAASKAVRSIGTNAVPALLEMLRDTESPAASKLRALAIKLRLADAYSTPAEERNHLGYCGFKILGPAARSAVPALIGIFQANFSFWSQMTAAHSLAAVGPTPQALHALFQATTNSVAGFRLSAIAALDEIPVPAADVLPALEAGVGDPDYQVSALAISALAHRGPDAAQAVPALVQATSTNASWRLRRAACAALGKIRSLPEQSVPALKAALSDPSPDVRNAAREGLAEFEFGPEPQAAPP